MTLFAARAAQPTGLGALEARLASLQAEFNTSEHALYARAWRYPGGTARVRGRTVNASQI